MAEEIPFQNGRIYKFKGLVTLTWDWVIMHTIVHSHRPLHTCQISLKSKKLFVDERTHACTHVRTDEHLRPAILGQLCRKVDLKSTDGYINAH